MRSQQARQYDGGVGVGFQGAHVHAVYTGVEWGECDLTGITSLAEYQRRVASYAAAHPDRGSTTVALTSVGGERVHAAADAR
ncbi:hypothetical protein [Streptomyces sp. SPB162]|uniref:hypothetical protein n=1 Tax=Streptomyces sp. SPB162 TaxID=2940560 RepID=UPI002405B459|nr:hypothetical protein [Streptomyces sp. SPB162]MDF9811482.1 putative amidohydrolase YtcJ [Streptomyces sp. SPB162]